jgi:hypothetical protein
MNVESYEEMQYIVYLYFVIFKYVINTWHGTRVRIYYCAGRAEVFGTMKFSKNRAPSSFSVAKIVGNRILILYVRCKFSAKAAKTLLPRERFDIYSLEDSSMNT